MLPLLLTAWLGCDTPAPPSVLIITLDTTRADRLGVYGGPAPTPAYDRVASQGAVFERAYSSTPLTIPSHATILTGLGPLSHGVRENGDAVLPEDTVTLAERLREQGYWTAAFTSAFPTRARWGLAQGFDTVHDDVTGLSTRDDYGDCRPANKVVDDALATLAQAGGDPAMVWVHLFDAHWPYKAPAPWSGQHTDPYNAELAFVAAQVDRLLQGWDAAYPDSVVVITADHGEALGEGGEPTHGILLNDGTLRVPLIVRGPGLEPGLRSDAVVGLQDITPTVLAMLGLPVEGVDGRDLRAGGSGAIYSESLTPRAMLGIAPLQALTQAEGRVTRGVDDRFTRYEGGRVAVLPDPGEPLGPWSERLGGWLFAHPEPTPRTLRLDDETQRALEALGYVTSDPTQTTAPIDPRDVAEIIPQIWQVRGLLNAGQLAAAEALVVRLETELAGSWASLRPRLELYQAQGRLHEAMAVGLDLYWAAPSTITALDLARMGVRMGDPVAALDWAEEALLLEPHNPTARSLQVQALLQLGQAEEAALLAELGWAADPSNLELGLSLAEIALAEGRLEEADALSAQLLAELPHLGWARRLRADVDWALGRSDEAIQGLGWLLDDDRTDLAVRLALAGRLLEVGRNAEAVRTLRPAAWLSGGDPLVEALLAEAEAALASERAGWP